MSYKNAKRKLAGHIDALSNFAPFLPRQGKKLSLAIKWKVTECKKYTYK